jgi:Glyoxalase-like domain
MAPCLPPTVDTAYAMATTPLTELDHLVVAARTLQEGVAWVQDRLGVAPQPGGQHLRMGTHNALVNLGSGAYLEVIAIDPSLAPPGRPRWFALDSPAIHEQLAHGPALIHWVARTANIERACRLCGDQHGDIVSMERGSLRWRISVPGNGQMPGRGLLPTLIQWDGDLHPTHMLDAPRVRLITLALRSPAPALLRATLDTLGLTGEIVVVGEGNEGLVAALQTESGSLTL